MYHGKWREIHLRCSQLSFSEFLKLNLFVLFQNTKNGHQARISENSVTWKFFVWKIYITYASFYSNLQTLQTQKISIVENYPKTWYLLQISKDKLDNIDPAVYLSYT